MFSTVSAGIVGIAQRARDAFPHHKPFVDLCTVVEAMEEGALREAMENHLLPVAAQLQKKNLAYFRSDPTFASLELDVVDLESNPVAVDEIFTMLNHTLLLQSTMSLLPPNLLDVAQSMASRIAGAVGSDGQIDQVAMGDILAQAMGAAGLYKQPISQMDASTAQAKLKEARRNLI